MEGSDDVCQRAEEEKECPRLLMEAADGSAEVQMARGLRSSGSKM